MSARTGPSPVGRKRARLRHHVLTGGTGVPLAVTLTGGNRNDVTYLLSLLDAVPPVRGWRSRPRRRPARVYAGRGYEHDRYRQAVRARGISTTSMRPSSPRPPASSLTVTSDDCVRSSKMPLCTPIKQSGSIEEES
jgi:hypothetical protein